MTDVHGRVAVVTGGGSGIGHGLATVLAAEGASVAVADLFPDRAEAVATEIRDAGGTAIAVECDVCDRASIDDLRRRATDELGPVSLLFANAGATALQRFDEMSDDDVEWLLHVNLVGVTSCLRAFLPDMLAARDGHVVATASMAGLLPRLLPNHVPYAAAKAGVIAMMLNLHLETQGSGVGCTVLCPGGATTRIAQSSHYRPERFGGPFDSRVKPTPELLESGKLETFGFRPPDEIARMVLEAVRENRPLVVTDPGQRRDFVEGYVDLVLAAFDDAAAFDQARSQ